MATELPDAPSRNESRRRRFLATVGLSVLAVAVLAGLYYVLFVRGYVSTDNAYVNGNLVQATAQTAGTVIEVAADETRAVTAGATLVRLDPVDARVAVERAENTLARAVRDVRGTFASTAGLDASVRAREAEVTRMQVEVGRARADVARREGLADEGGVSAEELAHARTALAATEAGLAAALAARAEAGQNLAATEVRIEGSVVATNPAVLQAAAELKEALIALERTRIVAPAAGVVVRRAAQLGARVQPGQVLATLAPLDEVWVDANFKEAQLRDLKVGQPVTLIADLYGSSVEYRGTVAGLAAGTGSAFSVLPAQNATGNWIKVVQRVPVRIALDPAELATHPLRLGLSMSVRVVTRDTSGAPLDSATPQPVYRTTVFDAIEATAEARVQEVIAAHLAPEAPSRAAPNDDTGRR